jgi:hypothetical protein
MTETSIAGRFLAEVRIRMADFEEYTSRTMAWSRRTTDRSGCDHHGLESKYLDPSSSTVGATITALSVRSSWFEWSGCLE